MRISIGVVFALAAAVVTACGSEDRDYGVLAEQVAKVGGGDSTQDAFVWAPDADGDGAADVGGSYPLVYMIPGSGGSAERDLDVVAHELARRGVVVFGADWRTLSGSVSDLEMDAECGYRLSRRIAADYGGDLSAPVTVAGFSMGATAALYVGINEEEWGPEGAYGECSPGEPRPDLVVALSGCHQNMQFPSGATSWGNREARWLLVAGSDDDVCPMSESEFAASLMSEQGYDVEVVEIEGAAHGGVVFHDIVDEPNVVDNWVTLPTDDPPGVETVDLILDAIESVRDS